MDLRSVTLATQCARCGSLWPKDRPAPCGACGGADIRPFYDFYAALGLPVGQPTDRELTSAYRKLSLKYHPDVNPAGKDVFLVLSEAFQTLKEPDRKAKYDARFQAVRRGEYASVRAQTQSPYEDAYPGGWQQRRPTPEEMEEVFREFHRMRQQGMNVYRASRIAGWNGAILGGLAGLFLGGIFAIPGAIVGWGFGRMNPGLAPLLVSVTTIALTVLAIISGLFAMRIAGFLGLGAVILLAWILFGFTRRWARELGMR